MSEIKVKAREFKRIDGKTFEIWARYTTKSEAKVERDRASKQFRHARVVKERSGYYAVWVTWIKGSQMDHLMRGGKIETHMDADGRLRSYYQ